MEKRNLIFVVLNYMNDEDTVECVDSIVENIDTDSYQIIIVDNNSPDGSGKRLQEHYQGKNEHIVVLLNPENKGNSEGWNYGIRYAKEHYEFEFISLPDNDCVFLETRFYEKTKAEFEKSNFAVMGPMILTPTGRCDANPIFDLPYTRKAALYDLKMIELKKKRIERGTYEISAKIRYVAKRLFPKLFSKKESRYRRFEGSFLERQENVVLHGCFLILSKVFFDHFEQLDVRSFMYAEEDILYMHVTHENLKTVYNPRIIAYHKGDGSTKKANKTPKKAELFRCEKSIEAINGYLSLLDELGIE